MDISLFNFRLSLPVTLHIVFFYFLFRCSICPLLSRAFFCLFFSLVTFTNGLEGGFYLICCNSCLYLEFFFFIFFNFFQVIVQLVLVFWIYTYRFIYLFANLFSYLFTNLFFFSFNLRLYFYEDAFLYFFLLYSCNS